MRILRGIRFFLFGLVQTVRIKWMMNKKFDPKIEEMKRELIHDVNVPDSDIEAKYVEGMHNVRVALNKETHRKLLALARFIKRKLDQ